MHKPPLNLDSDPPTQGAFPMSTLMAVFCWFFSQPLFNFCFIFNLPDVCIIMQVHKPPFRPFMVVR